MKKFIALLLLFCQILLASGLNFDLFYDENITNEQVDRELDKILNFMRQNPRNIDTEFDGERAIYYFIFNNKTQNTGKIDFDKFAQILKFNPDLNYDVCKFHSFKTTLLDLAISVNLEKKIISESELIALAATLVNHGYDIKSPELLSAAYGADSPDLFDFLLANGAKNSKNLLASMAVDFMVFIGKNGFEVNAKKPASSKMREFVKSAEFLEFYQSKIKYLQKTLKIILLDEFDRDNLDIFIKVNTYIGNTPAVNLLLQNGLCSVHGLKNSCENLKKLAKEFNSEEILRLTK